MYSVECKYEMRVAYLYASNHPLAGELFRHTIDGEEKADEQRQDENKDINGRKSEAVLGPSYRDFLGDMNIVIICIAAAIKKRMKSLSLSDLNMKPELNCFVDRHPRASNEKPSLQSVCAFISALHYDAQLETEIIMYGFILLLSILHKGKSRGLELCPMTWRPLLYVSLVISSKLYDDLSMINGSFAVVMRKRHMDLQQLNQMEIAVMVHILKFSTVCSFDTYKAFINAFIDAHNKVVSFISPSLVRSNGPNLSKFKQKSSVHYIWPIPTMKKNREQDIGDSRSESGRGESTLPHTSESDPLHNDRPY
eukprot:g1647.t1